MLENKSLVEIKSSSSRSFGFLISGIFLIIAFFPIFFDGNFKIVYFIISIILFFVSIFYPKIFSVPNKLWFKFSMLLGAIVAPLVMALIYFVTVTPIGLLMRLLGKDLLNKKIDKSLKSYWQERKNPINSMKDQY